MKIPGHVSMDHDGFRAQVPKYALALHDEIREVYKKYAVNKAAFGMAHFEGHVSDPIMLTNDVTGERRLGRAISIHVTFTCPGDDNVPV